MVSEKRGIFWAWRFSCRKNAKIPGAREIGTAISGPRMAGRKFTDTRLFSDLIPRKRDPTVSVADAGLVLEPSCHCLLGPSVNNSLAEIWTNDSKFLERPSHVKDSELCEH